MFRLTDTEKADLGTPLMNVGTGVIVVLAFNSITKPATPGNLFTAFFGLLMGLELIYLGVKLKHSQGGEEC